MSFYNVTDMYFVRLSGSVLSMPDNNPFFHVMRVEQITTLRNIPIYMRLCEKDIAENPAGREYSFVAMLDGALIATMYWRNEDLKRGIRYQAPVVELHVSEEDINDTELISAYAGYISKFINDIIKGDNNK